MKYKSIIIMELKSTSYYEYYIINFDILSVKFDSFDVNCVT